MMCDVRLQENAHKHMEAHRKTHVHTLQAMDYRQRILACVPADRASLFQPLMTCYLTDRTSPEEVSAAQEAGVVAFKLYPAGLLCCSRGGRQCCTKST
jgi:dihydroorotase